VSVERELLTLIPDSKKKDLFADSSFAGEKKSAPTNVDEKDEELNQKKLEKFQKARADESDEIVAAWKQLCTTKVYENKGEAQAQDRWGGLRPGKAGFNERARKLMNEDSVPSCQYIMAPNPQKPSVQPYQETVSYIVHPKSFPNPRILVVHRTGAGKTCSMIRICDNFFLDKRPKLVLFPTTAVCNNFYMELLDRKFPNRCGLFEA
jgi:hypothetical protein